MNKLEHFVNRIPTYPDFNGCLLKAIKVTQIIGYMRFSYPGRSDARLTWQADQDAIRAKLYDPLRMLQRFHFFEQICLPSLDAQTDQDFKLLILIGDDLPKEFRTRLDRVLSKRRYAELVVDGSGSLAAALNGRAAELKDMNAKKIIHFRIDDDDALASHVISDLRTMANRSSPRSVLTMPRGIKFIDLDGEMHLIEDVAPYIAIGWALVLPPEVERNAFQAAHLRIADVMPSQVDPRKISYIHTVHDLSDSRSSETSRVRQLIAQHTAKTTPEERAELSKTLSRNFPGFSGNYLQEVRATLPGQEAFRPVGQYRQTAIN